MIAALVVAALALAAEPPNILFVSVDTLRADRLGCYGCPLNTSPNIDRLAKEALLFEECVCEVPLTFPSLGSMLCSRFPRMTGTRRNGLKMPSEIPLVTEQFKAAGYYTFCVQSNWTLKAKLCGLDRGFDVYQDSFHTKRWGIVNPERTAEEVSRIALELLNNRPQDQPFFAWLHYSDPHAPYKKHRDYNPAGLKAWHWNKKDRVRARYASEVAYTDAHIGRVLDALPENTLVVFTADHGESLFEHGYLGHGRRIHQTGIHIPLIIRAPGLAPGRTHAPVCGTDIGPTLLGLAGLPKSGGMLGTNLMAALPPASRARIIETYGGAVPKVPGAKALMAERKPMRQGILLDGWKLILNGKDAELYCLVNDPGEENNLAEKEPARVQQLRALVEQWDKATQFNTQETEESLSQDDLQALESLGYLK